MTTAQCVEAVKKIGKAEINTNPENFKTGSAGPRSKVPISKIEKLHIGKHLNGKLVEFELLPTKPK